jgi:hypothetical protein
MHSALIAAEPDPRRQCNKKPGREAANFTPGFSISIGQVNRRNDGHYRGPK